MRINFKLFTSHCNELCQLFFWPFFFFENFKIINILSFNLKLIIKMEKYNQLVRMERCRAPKFLVDPLEGPSMRQCGRSWNLEHDPDFQH
jgi:hypothetical protein